MRISIMPRRTLLVLATLVCAFSPALAARYTYDHNGSTMRVDVEGGDVTIVYQRPRSSLERIGVTPGTMLFEGRLEDGYLEGLSHIFNRRCGEQDYFVYGDFTPDYDFRLTGAAPVLDKASCRVVDNVTEGSNANLVFTALGTPSPDPGPDPDLAFDPPVGPGTACVTGVNTTLNVRVGPSADHGRVSELPANACGIEVLDGCRGDWCLVRYGDTVGWTSMKYVRR